jgi:hypothetical protein
MDFFDMTPEDAARAFGLKLAELLAMVTYGGDIGFVEWGGKVRLVTSADVARVVQGRG